MDGGGRDIRVDGSDHANFVFFGQEATNVEVGGSTAGVYVFLTQWNLRSSFQNGAVQPSAFPSGTYDLRAFTYGYIQTEKYTAFARTGEVADLRIDLLVGANVSLDILFKKEHIITGTEMNMSVRVRLFDDTGSLVSTWMSSEGVYVTRSGVSRAADGTTPYPYTVRYIQTVPGSLLQSYDFLPAGTTLLHVLLAGLPQQPPRNGYFGDPIFTPYSCSFEIVCYRGSYGRWEPVGQTVYPFANSGIAGSPEYGGGWTAEVDFVNWYLNNTGAAPNYYPPVLGLLMGESYHIIPGTTATSGISLTEDTATSAIYLGHSMVPNHVGPYSQQGAWQISNAGDSGEASGIFEVDLNGLVSGNALAFTWSNEFRPLSWGMVAVAGASYRENHAAKTVTSVNGASIDTSQNPPFGSGAGKFVAASSQYLTVPYPSNWNFGTRDFTIDFWVKFNSLPTSGNYVWLMGQDALSNENYYVIGLNNNSGTYRLRFAALSGGSVVIDYGWTNTSPNLVTGTWYHIAVVRGGSNFYMFQNGAQIGSTLVSSTAMPTFTGGFYIGDGLEGFGYLDGWLKEVRVSNGIARWTSNFTPPTAEYTPDGYTALLLHMDGTNGSTTFTDSNSGSVNVELPSWNFYTYDGIYQVYTPPGAYQFTISSPGYASQSWSVAVNSGQTAIGENVYLEQSNIPVPEINQLPLVTISLLAASVYVLRRRQRENS
jgi:hypothetical protein